MTSKYQLSGFLTLGTFIPYPKVLKEVETENNKQVPIFMGHGKEDKLVPYEAALKSTLTLRQKGYYIEFKDYPRIGHEFLHFILMFIDRINPYGHGDIFRFFRSKNLPNGNVIQWEIKTKPIKTL